MKKTVTFLSSCYLLLTAFTAQAEDCGALFTDLSAYQETGVIGTNKPNFNAIYVAMTTNRNDLAYTSHSEGFLTSNSARPSSASNTPPPSGTSSTVFGVTVNRPLVHSNIDLRYALRQSISGELESQFSNRTTGFYTAEGCGFNEPPPSDGMPQLHIPTPQNFTVLSKDKVRVSFYGDSTVNVKFNGNPTATVPVTCSEGMMYGVKDNTIYTFSFKKTTTNNQHVW